MKDITLQINKSGLKSLRQMVNPFLVILSILHDGKWKLIGHMLIVFMRSLIIKTDKIVVIIDIVQ